MATEAAFSPREFRDALGGFATGVTIVTARDQNGSPVGMTASSFNSVSVDPPLVLWSVTKTALSASAFHEAQHFAVHVLSRDQVDLSNRFARSGADKFADLPIKTNANDVPVLDDPVSRFDCQQWAVYEGGDHWIIVGRVVRLVRRKADSLVFCAGGYATASPLRPGVGNAATIGDGESAIDGLLIYNLARAFHQMAGGFHDSVRASGLSVPEWRVLASLHGLAHRELPELAARTFIDPVALVDMVQGLQETGLCQTSVDGTVRGTQAGHDRVEHLFALGRDQELSALGADADEALPQLIDLLQTVIRHT